MKKPKPWQQSLINAITDPEELFSLLNLNDAEKLAAAKKSAKLFELRAPLSYVNKIVPNDWNDPLLKQILPIADEAKEVPGFNTDPLQEIQFNPIPGLLHKYRSRVLLTITSACGINCRYCFRRHFAYEDNQASRKDGRQRIIQYLKNHPEINEVIYSGGDPLLADDDYLADLTHEIMQVPHIKRLRIHSRLPIALPERIDEHFLNWFANPRWQSILVTHANHPNEIDEETQRAIAKLKEKNILVLNQTVLLRGINDNADILVELSEKLFAAGILPYYLHILDKVAGAAHFDLDEIEYKKLHRAIQAKLPGFLVPKLAKEEPGIAHKLLL